MYGSVSRFSRPKFPGGKVSNPRSMMQLPQRAVCSKPNTSLLDVDRCVATGEISSMARVPNTSGKPHLGVSQAL